MNHDNQADLCKSMVQFWASAIDAMLQDFQATMTNPEADRQAKAVATAKVAQVAILAFQWFNAGLTGIGPTPEEKEACIRAMEKVKKMCDKHIDELDRALDSEPVTDKIPRLLN